MVSDAARILKVAGKRGKNAVGYQGLRLATIKSVQPFKMIVDDVDSEYIADDVLVNAQMLDFLYAATLTHEPIGGRTSLTGKLALSSVFKDNDRVAVAAVGINKFLILCKVVNWQ